MNSYFKNSIFILFLTSLLCSCTSIEKGDASNQSLYRPRITLNGISVVNLCLILEDFFPETIFYADDTAHDMVVDFNYKSNGVSGDVFFEAVRKGFLKYGIVFVQVTPNRWCIIYSDFLKKQYNELNMNSCANSDGGQ